MRASVSVMFSCSRVQIFIWDTMLLTIMSVRLNKWSVLRRQKWEPEPEKYLEL